MVFGASYYLFPFLYRSYWCYIAYCLYNCFWIFEFKPFSIFNVALTEIFEVLICTSSFIGVFFVPEHIPSLAWIKMTQKLLSIYFFRLFVLVDCFISTLLFLLCFCCEFSLLRFLLFSLNQGLLLLSPWRVWPIIISTACVTLLIIKPLSNWNIGNF